MIGMHRCMRCGYEATTRQNLMKHITKESVCNNILDDITKEDMMAQLTMAAQSRYSTVACHECTWCQRRYRHMPSLYRHKHTCPARPDTAAADEGVRSATQSDIHNTDNNGATVTGQQTAGDHSTNNVTTTDDHSTTTNNNNNSSTNDQSTNIHVTINHYGNESIDHILENHDFMKRCAKSMLYQGIPNLLQKIHFDDEHPENQNVKLRSIKRDLMEIFSEDRWKVVPGTQTTEQLIHKGCRLLGDFYDTIMRLDIVDDETAEREDEYQRTMMKVTGKQGNDYYRLRRRTKTMILDEMEKRRSGRRRAQPASATATATDTIASGSASS